MEEGIRVTTQKKSKKTVTILLVITGILGLALIGVAIYFFTIKDTSTNIDTTTNVTCGCYYIDPAVIKECGDPRRAFQFETAIGSADTCKTACATSKLSTNSLNSSTQQDLYQICQLQTISDSRCQSMTITDKDGKIVTGKVSSSNQLNIEAVFDKEYTNYKFVINNESTEPDVISPNKLTIKKAITDLTGATAINIVATATTSDNQQINSPICRRLVEITQSGETNVNNLQLTTRMDVNTMKISNAKISVGNLTSPNNTQIAFTFGTAFPELIMTKGFTVDPTGGAIEVVEQDLYNANNFSNAKSFSQLNSHVGELTVKAEVYVASASIGSATSTITFPAAPTNENTNETTTTSSFSVTNTANLTCVERVSPTNVVQYTINVANKSTTSQNITSITDKLPLGFAYIPSTTKLNGVLIEDSTYVKVSSIGDTQQIVFSKTSGWTLSANQSLTIIFQSKAESNALTGSNKNEIVVTPEQIPTDPNSLRTSLDITVAQDCNNPGEVTDTPQTGIFDTTIFRIIIGITVILTGWFVYNKPNGQIMVEKLVNSQLYKTTELGTWRLFKPKKYFEESVIRKSQRKVS